MSDLLIHSLAEFREIILPALDVVGARSVVEIGGETGTFTRELIAWAQERDAMVRCIDPKPSDALVELADSSPTLELLACRSLEVLEELEPADVYLIDGDHNYWTLTQELRIIARAAADKPPVLFVHDVGWPAGRRDMYYDPASLPPEAVHPHEYERGVTVGCPSTVEHGFQGEGEFAWARAEGGPANGVLTAVEDFLDEHPDLELRVVPCVFGLGVVFPKDSPAGDALGKLLESYHGNPILERMEQNRLALYLQVLDLQHVLAGLERTVDHWTLRTRDVQVENRALWARVEELEARLAELSERHESLAWELRRVVGGRAFALGEKVSRLSGRLQGHPPISGPRLLELLEAAAPGVPDGVALPRPPASDPTTPRATP